MAWKRNIKSWLLRGLALLVLVWLLDGLFMSNHSVWVYQQERQTLAAMREDLDKLRKQREHLAKMIVGLRHDTQVQEDMVRRKLGFVYPDEYILMMPDDEQVEESK